MGEQFFAVLGTPMLHGRTFLPQEYQRGGERVAIFYPMWRDLLGGSLPGVVAAGGVTSMPFGAAKVVSRAPLAIDGRPPAPGEQSLIYTTAVAGDYFRAMGAPLLKGRLFDPGDTARSRQVVLISQNAAQQFWPGSDPPDRRCNFGSQG